MRVRVRVRMWVRTSHRGILSCMHGVRARLVEEKSHLGMTVTVSMRLKVRLVLRVKMRARVRVRVVGTIGLMSMKSKEGSSRWRGREVKETGRGVGGERERRGLARTGRKEDV